MPFATTLYKIAQLAVKAEEVGEDYYRHLAQSVKDDKVRQICLFFAEQERGHRDSFKEIAETVRADNAERTFEEDVISLMHGGIESLRQTGFQSQAYDPQSLDMKQCLAIALNVEEETVRLYQKIQSSLEGKYNALLYKIIHEESEHAKTIKNVIEKSTDSKAKAFPQQGASQLQETPQKGRSKIPQEVTIHKRVYQAPFQDYVLIVLLIILFLGLILAMIGPKTIWFVVRSIVGK